MRKQSVQEWLSVLSAILLLPRFVDIPVERTLTQEVISCLLASEIPMFLTKAIAVKVQKQHWIDFQAVAKPQLSRVNQETMLILSSRCNIQVHTQYVSLQYPRIFKTDLGSLDPSYRENLMEQTFGCLFAFPSECGCLPYGDIVRGNCYWKMTYEQAFSSSVLLSAHRMLGKLCSFDERKA